MIPAGLRPDDVAIDRLRVKGPRSEVDRLQRELAVASWPRSEGGGWVFIRQVHAKAPASRLTSAVLDRTRHLMEGPQGTGDSSQVVRFAGFAELLARLLADLAGGTASRRWYWLPWAHLFKLAPGRASIALMEAYPDHLPSVTAELARAGRLPSVWHRLEERETFRLIATVARRSDLWLPRIFSESIATEPPIPPLRLAAHLEARWAPTLKSLSAKDSRRLLALMLIGLERYPLFLESAPLRLITALGEFFDASPHASSAAADDRISRHPEATSPAPDTHTAGEVRHAANSTPQPRTDARQAIPRTSSQPTNVPEELPVEPRSSGAPQPGQGPEILERTGSDHGIPKVRRHSTDPVLVPHDRVSEDQALERAQQKAVEHTHAVTPTAASPRMEERIRLETKVLPTGILDSFHTEQGGLFFLLNFLKRGDVQALIRQASTGCDFAGGWGWLYRLGQELALDEADPVVGFLAGQMGLRGIDELASLPPLPAREQLLALARILYDRSGLWGPELLRLRGRVEVTPSHVDLYAALGSVRLPVRLAGLDLNPGWLPWLGRVVTFHYEG